jgi:hypothetical protein
MEGLETQSGPCVFLDETMVLLDDIVQIFYPADVEKHRIQDHILRIMAAFEINRHNGTPACSLFGKQMADSRLYGNSVKFSDRANFVGSRFMLHLRGVST